MSQPSVNAGKTAMRRTSLSRPAQRLLEDGLLREDRTFFDYGCGHGGDVRLLSAMGFVSSGWDPEHAPGRELKAAEIVNLGYVLNVIQSPDDRRFALREAWRLTKGVLAVSVRLTWDRHQVAGLKQGDGIVTSAGTFQKYFEPDEFRVFVESTLGQDAVTAAPGMVYVFRSAEMAQQLVARHARQGGLPRQGVAELLFERHQDLLLPLLHWVEQHRVLPRAVELDNAGELIKVFGSVNGAFAIVRRATGFERWADVQSGRSRKTSEARFADHLELLEPLIDFVDQRGRLPRAGELANEEELVAELGSVKRAFALVRRATGAERWEEAAARGKNNFLVYAALAAFGGRPRLSDLPQDLQYDARDLFGSYRAACDAADNLLFGLADMERVSSACAEASVGKLLPSALYAHVTAVARLSPLLRVYVGAAKVLTGEVDDATLVKMHREKPQVSFLVYPTFDKEAHPALEASIVSRFRERRMTHRYFGDSSNPPILHRKDSFVGDDYPGWAKFRRLTLAEERAGVLDRSDIGRMDGWMAVLDANELFVRGHSLRKRQP